MGGKGNGGPDDGEGGKGNGGKGNDGRGNDASLLPLRGQGANFDWGVDRLPMFHFNCLVGRPGYEVTCRYHEPMLSTRGPGQDCLPCSREMGAESESDADMLRYVCPFMSSFVILEIRSRIIHVL